MNQLIHITPDVIFAAVVLGSEWGAAYRHGAGGAKAAPFGSRIGSRETQRGDDARQETSETGATQMAMF